MEITILLSKNFKRFFWKWRFSNKGFFKSIFKDKEDVYNDVLQVQSQIEDKDSLEMV